MLLAWRKVQLPKWKIIKNQNQDILGKKTAWLKNNNQTWQYFFKAEQPSSTDFQLQEIELKFVEAITHNQWKQPVQVPALPTRRQAKY